MAQFERLKRYIDAGQAFTEVTRARAEELVHDLIQAGEVEATRAHEWVEDLVSNSRERSEAFISSVRNEVRAQLSDIGVTNLDELAQHVAHILQRGQAAAREASRASRPKRVTKKAPAKKRAVAKKAPAKKRAVAKKAPAKKEAAVRRA